MTLQSGQRYTVYDAMEASGYFSKNPANVNSRNDEGLPLYKGPVEFPMMLYHPQGHERVLVPGVKERTSWGTVETFGEQWEIVSKQVNSKEELAEAIAEGWHRYPAMAIRAANETWRKERGLTPLPVPAISAQSHITELEEKNRKLTELLEEAKKQQEALGTSAATSSSVKNAGLV